MGDLQELAVARLRLGALVVMGMASFGSIFIPFAGKNTSALRKTVERPHWLIPVIAVVALGVWLSARSPKLDNGTKLNIGLLSLVVLSAIIGIHRHWLPYESTDVLRGASLASLAILGFAVVVPVHPWRMAFFALLAAAMDPLTLAYVVSRGAPSPRPKFWLWLFIPTAIATAAAIVTAHLMHAMGKAITRAQELGSYRLVERLGEGGMGEVWRAEHHTLVRPAAIKLIKPERLARGDNAKALERFEREAQATATLTSPHSVELYDFGVTQDGQFYFVMEMLEGRDLRVTIDEDGAMSPERVVHLLMQVCHSLRDAHDHGLIHRDIKPANLFICRRGRDEDFVKVLDFGLVKEADGELAKEAESTIMGTPAYMAPEVVLGKELSPRTDIYALGCVAFEALTGEPLFDEKSVAAVLAAHLDEPPRRPSDLVRGIDAPLEALVLRCLEKDPAKRPESCDEILLELQTMAHGPLTVPGRFAVDRG